MRKGELTRAESAMQRQLRRKQLTNQEHGIMTRFTAKLAQQKKHMNFSVRPLFRKMKSDGSGE